MRIPYEWNHFRYIDFHGNKDYAIGFVSLSSFNEEFIWEELNISPRTNTVLEIVDKMVEKSGNYKFLLDKIDPLAKGQKSNTKKEDGTVRTTVDDINGYLAEFKRQGVCEGGYFTTANTKGTRGREKIRQRLRNSLIVKTPFNNEASNYLGNEDVINIEREKYLPTLWVLAPCKQVRLSLKNWRMEKGEPSQQYSDHCTGLEFLHKDARFRPPVLMQERLVEREKVLYFQGRR